METNPIVVFVVPDSIGASDHDFPIGWTAGKGEKRFNVGANPTESYSVIFLNDILAVPSISFANKHTDKALLVITHITSELNGASRLPNSDLRLWGKPIPCASYHRQEKNHSAWVALEALFSQSMTAADFAKKWQDQFHLGMYEDLIILSAIKVFNPAYTGPDEKNQWNEEWNKRMVELPTRLQDDLAKLEGQAIIDELRNLAGLLGK